MFSFLSMYGTYEDRKVNNLRGVYKDGLKYTIYTCMVTDDEDHPYETAISHESFNSGSWIIVEQYTTKDLSVVGHNQWVEKFNTEIPEKLPDCQATYLEEDVVYVKRS